MPCRHLLYLTLALALSGCSTLSPVALQEKAAEDRKLEHSPPPQASSEPASTGIIDTTRQKVRGFANWLGTEVNDWFGDKPFSDGGKVSEGRLSLRLLWEQDDGLDTNVRFRARFSLPNLRDKAYVFFGQDNERELISDLPQAFSRDQQLLPEDRRADHTGFVGLGVDLREHLDFRIGVRGGLKPYAQTRYRREWALSANDRLEFYETLFWRSSDGFGSTTSLNLEHAYTPSLSLKWQNAATVTEETDGFAWSSSLGLFKKFGDNRLLSTEALINGETKAKDVDGEYGLRVKWTQPVYRDWLLGELIIGHFWPRGGGTLDRDNSWAVGAGLIMHF